MEFEKKMAKYKFSIWERIGLLKASGKYWNGWTPFVYSPRYGSISESVGPSNEPHKRITIIRDVPKGALNVVYGISFAYIEPSKIDSIPGRVISQKYAFGFQRRKSALDYAKRFRNKKEYW